MQLELNMEVNMEELVEVMDKLLLIQHHHPLIQQETSFLVEVNNMVKLLLIQHNLFMPVKLSLIQQEDMELNMVVLNMVALEKLSLIPKEDTLLEDIKLEDIQLEDMLQVDPEFVELPHTLQEDQEFVNNINDSMYNPILS